MAKKICGQVNIPEVDESQSACDFFTNSECVIVTYKSSFVKNKTGGNLNEYLELLDAKLNKMNNQIYQLTKIIEILQTQITPPDGIGVFPTS